MHRRRRSSTSPAPRSILEQQRRTEDTAMLLNHRRTLLAAFAALGACVAAPAAAQDYYAGRTIDLVIGSGPAGGYDIYGRALARHFNRYIPGKPNIVVKNMPGAGSGRAAGFLAKIAPKDG